jgi:hypothetical protein
LTIIESTRPPR